ncbi:hypothetical protein IW15_05075 [Chryseobacterium soli]|uniref:Uncharacterized protein n=1 Tax=Chryseobacterium soli TaxID=445961 RepID=A0A086ADP4_9FLAO|nr:hypothetical protein [Chryseobacterium soli]KFF14808.1 hypothetical protein IW15_05075 [Chryseobacterium soli]
MKFQFGIIFYSILEIITLLSGVYFFKLAPIFSVIFFIAFITIATLLYKEYTDSKRKPEVMNEKEIPKEINLKKPLTYSITTIFSYLIFIIVSVFFLILYIDKTPKQEIFIMIMPIAVILLFIILIIMKIRKASDVIISINAVGIQLYKKPRMSWDIIENQRLRRRYVSHRESRFNERGEINYLQFFCKGEKFEVIISELEISPDLLEHYLNIYKNLYQKNNSMDN